MNVFDAACHFAVAYRSRVAERRVRPDRSYRKMLAEFSVSLPEEGTDETDVIRQLASLGEPGLMQVTHPRFFGWVMGGSAPVGVAADWLASAWGQNAANHVTSPTSSAIEEVAAGWLLDILDLPPDASVGFTSGATMGSFTALAAARDEVLRRSGWDCEKDGLCGGPGLHVFVGKDVHASVLSALRYLGFGAGRVIRIASDSQGRMIARDLEIRVAERTGPKIIIAQAGQINTGAFDPFADIAQIARKASAWLHVDGAFGLWARATPGYSSLTMGVDQADSWAVDGHKWLQVPFDCGYAIVRDAAVHQRAMAISASYLQAPEETERVPSFFAPELSRRARGLPTWAVLKSLGRNGVVSLIEQHCAIAKHLAGRLDAIDGVRVVNDVVLNQIIVRFGADTESVARRSALTKAVVKMLIEEGEIYVEGANWRGEWIMRISVISWATTMQDAEITAETIERAWTQTLRVQ